MITGVSTINFKVVNLILNAVVIIVTFNSAILLANDMEVDEIEPDHEELGGNFEGDMILDDEQLDILNGFADRNGIISWLRRWSREIPFVIDISKFDREQIAQIYLAIQQFHCISCIRFVSRKPTHHDYIFITDSGKGCNSHVGRIGGRQNVNLRANRIGYGCFRLGSIMHELMHALGFYHMQSSSVRDKYVKIAWPNIKKEHLKNFQSYPTNVSTSYGLPYDYDSLMHYSNKAFGNGIVTMIPMVNRTIGQRKGLSLIDAIKLNTMYECV